MPRSSEQGLFKVLEDELRVATEPLDCATLFDRPAVREHAQSVNRVSDYLGHLWRKGLVTRLPAPRGENTRSRWMYVWKGKAPAPRVIPPDGGIPYIAELKNQTRGLNKPQLEISEDGGVVTIDTPHLTITIRQK